MLDSFKLFDCDFCGEEFLTFETAEEILRQSVERIGVPIDMEEELILVCSDCFSFQITPDIAQALTLTIGARVIPNRAVPPNFLAEWGVDLIGHRHITSATAIPARVVPTSDGEESVQEKRPLALVP